MLDAVRRGSTAIAVAAAVFRNPDLGRLQLAWASFAFAEWSFAISLGVYAFEVGGAALVGVAALVRLVPGALASPLAGLLGDTHSRRSVLLVSTTGSAGMLVAAAAAANAGASAAIVFALAGAFTVASCAYIPAEGALMPLIARTPQELSAANVTHSVMDNAGFMAGALIGALLLAAGGPELVFVVAGAAALGAAAMIAAVAPDERPSYAGQAEAGALRETAAGLRELGRHPEMRLAGVALTLLVLFEGAADVLAVVVALDLLGLGESSVGLLNAAWGIGALVGSAALAVLLDRGQLAAGVLIGCLLVGAATALPAAWAVAAAAYLAWLGIGVGYTFTEVAARTLLQRLGSDEALSRVLGSLETARYAAMGLGSIAVPALIALVGIRGTLVAFAALLPAFALLRWGALRRLDAGAPLDAHGYGRLREDPIFKPLPVAAVERLGHALVPLDVEAGARIITEGERGDHFYIVDSGQVEVFEGSRSCGHMGPGTSFGEIALLRDVPRTATVRAVGTTRLLALGRASFLDAVTGQRRCAEAADAVIEARTGASR